MPRVKRGKIALKRRHKVLGQTKGFRWQRKSKERAAKEALLHAGRHAFGDRRKKKRNFRALWNIKINAAARENGMSYSKLIYQLKKSDILLNRKMLAELAEKHPEVFKAIIKEASA
ncbi:50S ribosomal protein L20 [Candidatus Giovannonibacteria bacterium RIFCSPLOWO2_12_FULL_44_25]|uniref:Large ribosomal subunit protein bL20 n=1 Tax=Candidatus Giovannonibacteria bacterium RIFCSPHIGHO2_02_FULL_45_40 TaxID=1798337 RepID=A0A1F5W936_9BACT|nr:MAG: 50S ribosomal protein L20 [Candidatus Giovannonibacteria bacterium GWA2_45_15]OGF59784.1 MAG: 50S ribosomal protein L20 [Candidatus Giovannonibacteria bacterium RIFCSPHIGHO2_01_45_12]OGF60992.1 MAG: 50S ribosomal protein L20 [Candidatus Giovannonibacteria bacterium RIFCSPHIGHO2_01_FULL_44_100]OGF72167.1 MAG: 50S ribosomal protein L20 [Candidatus Giovannonibacteria bacterium RIFCSPHIGHO2_02_FULL_45_40]OGF84558.1 MAG: 50S ribosomal protein L20 [Candidatus Giovannonibacteria bacterium RIFC